jgi:hypothetical protein
VAGGTSSISPWAILHVGQRLQLSINHQLAHEAFPHARTALACDSYRYSIIPFYTLKSSKLKDYIIGRTVSLNISRFASSCRFDLACHRAR